MIVHVFTANRYHLVPSISKGFATVYCHDAEQFFIFFGNEKLDKKLYIDQFRLVGFDNYVFCQSYYQLIKLIFQHRNDALLFHAGNFSWHLSAILLGCKNINWVCWGGGTSISGSLRSKIGSILKRYKLNHLRSIVTLMEPEREQLIKYYGMNPEKVQTIAYTSTNENETKLDLYCKELACQNSMQCEKPIVLLGNSHHWIKSYIHMLPRLQQYKGKINVQCMLNYEFEKGEKYEDLVNLGRSVFGDDFKTNEEFYSNRIDYINYINNCDIYICAVEKQTGLGAISNCLKLGKKIYITGDNLEWVRQAYNSIVFPLEDINANLSYQEFIRPLSIEEKTHNYQNRVNCRAINREKWHSFLKYINS